MITEKDIKKIMDILIDEGQHDKEKFRLGEIIKYNPVEVRDILVKRINELNERR